MKQVRLYAKIAFNEYIEIIGYNIAKNKKMEKVFIFITKTIKNIIDFKKDYYDEKDGIFFLKFKVKIDKKLYYISFDIRKVTLTI